MTAIDVYLNWTLYAVYGLMSEADALRRKFGGAINEIADELNRRHPIAEAPLYRGMLLDSADTVRPKPNLTFLSWSEDRDVARWFGHRESYISEPFVEMFPHVQGYVMTLAKPATRVLFHHSWRGVFGMPLEHLGLMHPLIGADGARQIKWSLSTQREVITEPLAVLPRPEPIETVPGASIADLDRRLMPSWIHRIDVDKPALCPECEMPGHASETDDNGYHAECQP